MKKSNAWLSGLLTVGVLPMVLGACIMAYTLFFDQREELSPELLAQVSPYVDVEALQETIDQQVQQRRAVDPESAMSDTARSPASVEDDVYLVPPEILFDELESARPMSGDFMDSGNMSDFPSSLEPTSIAEELLVELEYRRLERKEKMEYISFWVTIFGGVNTAAMGWFTMIYRRREHDA